MNIAVIPAAGYGKRMNSDKKKQYIEVDGKPILAYTLEVFQNCESINGIILVVPEDEIVYCKEFIVDKYKISKVISIVCGGKERQNSVFNGLDKIKNMMDCREIDACQYVLIHDAARPFVTYEIIENCLNDAYIYGASCAAVKVKDTIKQCDEGFINKTLNRESLFSIQTPQTFRFDIIYNAHLNAMNRNILGTDDCYLVEYTGQKIKIVESSYSNIKITTPEDLIFFNYKSNVNNCEETV